MAALVAWGSLQTLSGRLSGSSRGVLRKVSGRSSGIARVFFCAQCPRSTIHPRGCLPAAAGR
eukprot:4992374-Alexandrium_andersonii.AAC.1